MPKSTTQPEAAKPKPSRSSVTREQLVKAAKLRGDGATWDQIREATGTKLGSSAWFRYWEREGIEHIPAGERPAKAKPTPEPEPAAEAAPKAKPKRTVRRSAAKK